MFGKSHAKRLGPKHLYINFSFSHWKKEKKNVSLFKEVQIYVFQRLSFLSLVCSFKRAVSCSLVPSFKKGGNGTFFSQLCQNVRIILILRSLKMFQISHFVFLNYLAKKHFFYFQTHARKKSKLVIWMNFLLHRLRKA